MSNKDNFTITQTDSPNDKIKVDRPRSDQEKIAPTQSTPQIKTDSTKK